MPNCPTATPGQDIAPLSPNALVPEKVTDLSPGLALFYKVTVFVRHSDGSLEEFYLAPEIADKFIQELPVGDELVFVDARSLQWVASTQANHSLESAARTNTGSGDNSEASTPKTLSGNPNKWCPVVASYDRGAKNRELISTGRNSGVI
jgi:hypothetical protein